MATKVSKERRRRRFDPQSRRPSSWRDRTSPAAREFLEFAHERLEQVEEAALAADPGLDSELEGLVGDVAATCARVRIRLERNERPSALRPIEAVEDDGPSEGVLLLTRQDQATWIHDLATPAGSLVAGVEFVRQQVLPQANEAGEPIYLRDRRDTKSAFASWNETWRGQRVEASIRRDDDEQYGSRNTGAVSMAGQATPGGTRAVVTVSRGFRAPTFNDLYLTFPGYTPNPELRPERSRSRELSLRGTWGPVSEWRLTGFDNRLEDLIVFSPTAGTVLNLARARVRGVELRFEAQWLSTKWRGAYTVQRPKDEETGARLQTRAARFGSFEASRSWGSWTAGLSVVGSGERFDSIDESPGSRMPSYVRVDARLRYDISKMWKAELHAVNLGDRRYETALGYDAPGRGVMLNVRFEAF